MADTGAMQIAIIIIIICVCFLCVNYKRDKLVELSACPAGVHIDEPSPPVTPVFQTQIPDDMRRKHAGLSPSTGKEVLYYLVHCHMTQSELFVKSCLNK